MFDRLILHCLDWFAKNPQSTKATQAFSFRGRLWLTTSFKRKLLESCIFGIDVDPVAVQVAQMSLCLKVLEDETQEALTRELALFPKERFLPSLDNNIIHANSLVPVSAYPDYIDANYLAKCNPVDRKALLGRTRRNSGFDAVIANPPWGADVDTTTAHYLRTVHRAVIRRMPDTYIYFTHLAVEHLLRPGGKFGFVLPGTLLNQSDACPLRSYLFSHGINAVADLGQGIFSGALNTTCIIAGQKGGERPEVMHLNSLRGCEPELRESQLQRWVDSPRALWETAVKADPSRTFFTGNTLQVSELADARSSFAPLSELLDKYGIQRGVTPDFIRAHLLTQEESIKHRIEISVLRKTIRGEDVQGFHTAPPTMRLIYTTRKTQSSQIPNAIAYLKNFQDKISCKEVRSGKHPWWRLHRARAEGIFKRSKIIGLTTSRRIELVWDEDQDLVVTDAMYVFAPKAGVPHEYLLGVMQSNVFSELYRTANQGDARVIPQIKATKLSNMPVPSWDSEDKAHQGIVSIVRSLIKLSQFDTDGARRTFGAQRRNLEELVCCIYQIDVPSTVVLSEKEGILVTDKEALA